VIGGGNTGPGLRGTPEGQLEIYGAFRSHRLGALFSTPLAARLRRGEALGLHWNDVSLEAGMLTVRYTLQRVVGNLLLGEAKTPKSRATIRLLKY
jgi:integrase